MTFEEVLAKHGLHKLGEDADGEGYSSSTGETTLVISPKWKHIEPTSYSDHVTRSGDTPEELDEYLSEFKQGLP